VSTRKESAVQSIQNSKSSEPGSSSLRCRRRAHSSERRTARRAPSATTPCARGGEGEEQEGRTHVGGHVLLAPVVARPVLARRADLLGELVVRTFAVGRAAEERHDVVQVRVVDLDGDVAARRVRVSQQGERRRRPRTKGTHWSQGWMRSPYLRQRGRGESARALRNVDERERGGTRRTTRGTGST